MDDKSPGGWGVFAGLMLIMTGTFNAVEGIASLTAPTRLFVGEEKMLGKLLGKFLAVISAKGVQG